MFVIGNYRCCPMLFISITKKIARSSMRDSAESDQETSCAAQISIASWSATKHLSANDRQARNPQGSLVYFKVEHLGKLEPPHCSPKPWKWP